MYDVVVKDLVVASSAAADLVSASTKAYKDIRHLIEQAKTTKEAIDNNPKA